MQQSYICNRFINITPLPPEGGVNTAKIKSPLGGWG